MKKAKFLFPLMLLLAVIMCLPAFAETNFWPNETFDGAGIYENGDYSGLYMKQGAPTDWLRIEGDPLISTSDASTNKSLKCNPTNTPFFSNDKPLGLVNGAQYKLSFKVYTKSSTEIDIRVYTSPRKSTITHCDLYGSSYDTTGCERILRLQSKENAGAWDTFEHTFTASDDTQYVTFDVRTPTTVRFDDIKIVPLDASGEPDIPDIPDIPDEPDEPIVTGTNFWPNETFDGAGIYENGDYSGLYMKVGAPTGWLQIEGDPLISTSDASTNKSLKCNPYSGGANTAPFFSNDQPLGLVNGAQYKLSFKVYTKSSPEIDIRVYTSPRKSNKDYCDLNNSTGCVRILDIKSKANAGAWDTFEHTFTASDDTQYVTFDVRGTTAVRFDDIIIEAVGGSEEPGEPEPQVVAAGLKNTTNTDTQSIAFAAYIPADQDIDAFGFVVVAADVLGNAELTVETENALSVDTTNKIVADNGDFCGVDADGNYYLVSVNGIKAAHFDDDIVVRAYAVLDGTYYYSDAVTTNVNDVVADAIAA